MFKCAKNGKFYIEFAIVVLLLADLFFQVLPVFLLAGAVIILQFARLDYTSNSVLMFFFFPALAGFVFRFMDTQGAGGAVMIVGFLMILFGILTGRIKLRKWVGGFILLLVLFAMMFISMKTSTGGGNPESKLVSTVTRGVQAFVTFSVIFSNFRTSNVKGLGVYIIVYAAFLLRLSLFAAGMEGPESLGDFGFIRRDAMDLMENEEFHVSYHYPGLFFLQGMSLFLMSGAFKRQEVYKWFIAGLLLLLYAGARQMVVVIFAMIIIWVIRSYAHKGIWQLTVLVLLAVALYLGTSVGELFETVTEEGYIEGGGRGPWLLQGVELFRSNMTHGVGFGQYNFMGDYTTYPHNLIVEILCEMGIVGFAVFLAAGIIGLLRAKRAIGTISYYLLAVFLFSMASGSLTSNIIVFSLLFAAKSLYKSGTGNAYPVDNTSVSYTVSG